MRRDSAARNLPEIFGSRRARPWSIPTSTPTTLPMRENRPAERGRLDAASPIRASPAMRARDVTCGRSLCTTASAIASAGALSAMSASRPASQRTPASESTATTDHAKTGNQSDRRVTSADATIAGSVDALTARTKSTMTSALAPSCSRPAGAVSRRSAKSTSPGKPSARSTSASRSGTLK